MLKRILAAALCLCMLLACIPTAQAATLAITRQPANTTVAEGKTATVSVGAAGDGLTYRWYYKDAGASVYSASSVTTASYSLLMNTARSGRRVYCRVTDKYGNTVNSNSALLTVATPARITRQPANTTVAAGKTATVSVGAAGDGLTYRWYYKDAGASVYSASSVTTASYSLLMNAARSGRRVYCRVTDKYGNTVNSNSALLTVANPARITRQPANTAVAAGKTATVSVAATGDGLTYRWYYKDAGASVYSASSVTTASYSLLMNAARSGRRVYCRVTDKYGNVVNSNSALLNVATPVKITRQPDGVTVASGETATVSVTATGDGLSYRWYYKDAGATAYAKSSVTTASYSLLMNAARSGRQVYCEVTDRYGYKAVSGTVTLQMEQQDDGREYFDGMWQAGYYGNLTCTAASVGIQSLMVIEDGEIYIQRKMTDGVISAVFYGTMKDGLMHFSGEGCTGTLLCERVDGKTYMIDMEVEVDGVSHLLIYVSL